MIAEERQHHEAPAGDMSQMARCAEAASLDQRTRSPERSASAHASNVGVAKTPTTTSAGNSSAEKP